MLIVDTLEYSKELQTAGFTQKQSEVLVRFQNKAFQNAVEKEVATKGDLQEVKHELQAEIQEVRHEIQEVRQEFKYELQKVKDELDVQMQKNNVTIIKWIVGMGLTLILSQVALSFVIVKFFALP